MWAAIRHSHLLLQGRQVHDAWCGPSGSVDGLVISWSFRLQLEIFLLKSRPRPRPLHVEVLVLGLEARFQLKIYFAGYLVECSLCEALSPESEDSSPQHRLLLQASATMFVPLSF